jgi:hypothetical protein
MPVNREPKSRNDQSRKKPAQGPTKKVPTGQLKNEKKNASDKLDKDRENDTANVSE